MKSTTAQPSAKTTRPPSRPRRAAKAPGASDAAAPAANPGHEQRVREAAYFIYERSGRVAGRELENWMEAEALLLHDEAQAAKREATLG